MFNKNELRAQIVRKGLNYEDMAKKLGISRQAFSLKMNGQLQFRYQQIIDISTILELTAEERDAIFFANEVANVATEDAET